MSDEVRTRAEVMEWLPGHIRDALAVTTPCTGGGDHDWQHTRTEFHKWGQVAPAAVIEHWLCRDCGAHTNTDPGEFA